MKGHIVQVQRRTVLAGSVAAVAALGVSGCSFDQGSSGGSDGSSGASSELRIVGWGGNQWSQNFNVFSPTAAAVTPGSAFFYEPLVRLDRTKAGVVLPYLATEWEFNAEGTELTFTLRDDVTWNDDTPFTAADVAFTWQLVIDGETKESYPFTAVEAVDDTRVLVSYDQPAFNDLVPFARRPILPRHVWENENVSEFTNPEPVGTGPFVLDSFSPQQVSLKLRDGYWGGETKGVRTIKIQAMSNDAAKDALLKGDVDYGTMGWSDGKAKFVDVDPENHEYTFYPVGTADGLSFNCAKAPFDDPAVRRALRDSVDLQAAADAVKVGYLVPTISGLDKDVYAAVLAPDQEQKPDPAGALADLEAAGWSIADGKLVKGSDSYEVRYDVYQPYTEWVLTAQFMAAQWKEKLGLNVQVNELAEQPYSDVMANSEYGMISNSPTSGSQISDVVAEYNSALVGEPTDNKGNKSFYKNDRIDAIGEQLRGIAPGEDQAQVKALAIEAQEIFTEDAPFIATATAGWKAVFNKKRWDHWPVMGETTFVPNNTLYADAVLTALSIEPR